MQFASQMQLLAFSAQEAQDTLSIIQQFAAGGGAFRLSIAVDHPDPTVRELVERVAASNLPREIIMKNLVKVAERDLEAAHQAMVDLGFSFSIAKDSSAAAVRPSVVGAAA